jgi:hypothetical protein
VLVGVFTFFAFVLLAFFFGFGFVWTGFFFGFGFALVGFFFGFFDFGWFFVRSGGLGGSQFSSSSAAFGFRLLD